MAARCLCRRCVRQGVRWLEGWDERRRIGLGCDALGRIVFFDRGFCRGGQPRSRIRPMAAHLEREALASLRDHVGKHAREFGWFQFMESEIVDVEHLVIHPDRRGGAAHRRAARDTRHQPPAKLHADALRALPLDDHLKRFPRCDPSLGDSGGGAGRRAGRRLGPRDGCRTLAGACRQVVTAATASAALGGHGSCLAVATRCVHNQGCRFTFARSCAQNRRELAHRTPS